MIIKIYNQNLRTPFILLFSFIFTFLISCGKDDDTTPLSSEKEPLNFIILDDISGTIDHSAQTVAVTVPFGTDINSISPVLNLSENTTYTPTGEQNFSSPVVYTLTAEDGSQTQYTVSVTVAPNNEAHINFAFLAENNSALDEDISATIVDETKTITTVVPYGTDVTALIPIVEVSPDASFTPEGTQNFSSEVTYTVTAEDGSKVTYQVTLEVANMTPREALLAIYNANPGNTLGWDVNDPDISNWQGITVDENGVVTKIDFYDKVITTLPPEIGQLVNLEELLLNFNELTTLPAEIGQLVNLKNLRLRSNKITSLPSEIEQLVNLTELDIARNEISIFPSEITHLVNLTGLSISRNNVKTLPAEIGNLVNLEILYLDSNQINSIPSEIALISRLLELDLSTNQLTSIPSEIGGLTALNRLELTENLLTSIPEEVCDMEENYGSKIYIDEGVICE